MPQATSRPSFFTAISVPLLAFSCVFASAASWAADAPTPDPAPISAVNSDEKPAARQVPSKQDVQVGNASWYGRKFHGRKTASGAHFDREALTAAHRSLPLHSWAKVTLLGSDKSVVVQINDRGPHARNRLIDLSHAAAEELGFVKRGVARVSVEPCQSLKSCLVPDLDDAAVAQASETPDTP